MYEVSEKGSKAGTVDTSGNVFGEAIDDLGQIHAVEFVPESELSALLQPRIGSLALALTYRR